VVTGASTPGWPDPHADREPADEEYSRCLDPGKFRILDARVTAWEQVLTGRGVAASREVDPHELRWLTSRRPVDELVRVQVINPVQASGPSLVLATTLVDGEPFGLDLGLLEGGEVLLNGSVPMCGCDACDDGSELLLEEIDDAFLALARGGVVAARGPGGEIFRTLHGWHGTGPVGDTWLDPAVPPPPGVRRWVGEPWL
jgi:hypothetical protein